MPQLTSSSRSMVTAPLDALPVQAPGVALVGAAQPSSDGRFNRAAMVSTAGPRTFATSAFPMTSVCPRAA